MNQIRCLGGLRVKCQIEQDGLVELASYKVSKVRRIYYPQNHLAHPNDEKNLIQLNELFHNIELENENLISQLCLMIKEIKELIIELNQELRKKQQLFIERLQQLNTKQLNQNLDQLIKYDEIKICLQNVQEACQNNIIIQIKKQIQELKLNQNLNIITSILQTGEQFNISSKSQEEQEKAEELYQKGIQMSNLANKLQQDKKYEEAIKILDAVLLINQNHLQSLKEKAWCLYMLSKYQDAIIWADKALSIDSKSLNSMYIKAECLYYLHNFNDSIQWIDQALSIDSKNSNWLNTKGQKLCAMGKYEEALKFFDQSLNCDPNSSYNIYLKGNCLQQLLRYKEAIVYFDKSLQIDPNYLPTKLGKAHCEKQLNQQEGIK